MLAGTGRRAGYVGENYKLHLVEIPLFRMLGQFLTYDVVLIQPGNPPVRLSGLITDAQSPPLSHGIIQGPSTRVDIFLWSLWLICEGIKFLNATEFTCPGSDTIVCIPCFPVVVEVEADKGEIATPQADRTRLSRGSWAGTEGAVVDDGICDPKFSWFDRLAVRGGGWLVDKNEMMRSQM